MTEAASLPRTAAPWKSATDGLQLIVFGVFLLLTSQGFLPWSFWLEAISLWPVLLVGAGLRMIFERSRLPWIMLLSPVLVAAALLWLARGGQPAQASGPWVERQAARPADVSEWKLEGKGFMTRLDVQARSLDEGLLARGMSSSAEGGERIDVRTNDAKAVVKLRTGEGTQVFIPGSNRRKQSWKLDVTPDLPMELEVGGAGSTGQIDLARGKLTWAKIDGAFNNLELHLPVPASTTNLRVEGIFNGVRLLVPRGTAVRMQTEGILNSAEPMAGEAGPEYLVVLDGIGNSVDVVEAPSPR
jgi:hypothetical protein